MQATPLPDENVDEIMRRIREELAREQYADRQTNSSHTDQHGVRGQPASPDSIPPMPFTPGAEYRVEDFLALEDEAFLRAAYLAILGRDLDDAGRALFLEKLHSKKLSKIELLARLRYSKEGRARKVPVHGKLAARGLVQASFRIPVLGNLLAVSNYLVKLPVLAATLQATESGLRSERERNDSLWSAHQQSSADLSGAVNQLQGTIGPLWEAIGHKVDNADYVADTKRSSEVYWEVLNQKVDKQPYFDGYGQLTDALSAIQSQQQDLIRRYQEQKVGLIDQQRRIALLLEEARKRMPEPFTEKQVGAIASAAEHWLDAHYVSFEDVFRGTREDIKQRAQVYLPTLRAANAGSKNRPVIDIGCGRGELLETLKESGLAARGVDLNQVLIRECQDMGLDVVEADAITYLKQLPAASVGAVTGLHIIEHIPFEGLVRLLDETLRVLSPGGVVAFETPNPENILVGACNFYYDPTHLNPLPPPVTQFLLEARGFVNVEIKRLGEGRSVETLPLASPEEPGSESLNRVIEFINTHFAAEPDYAVIGYKA